LELALGLTPKADPKKPLEPGQLQIARGLLEPTPGVGPKKTSTQTTPSFFRVNILLAASEL